MESSIQDQECMWASKMANAACLASAWLKIITKNKLVS